MATTVETVVIESATADDRTEAFFRALGLQERVRVRPGAPGSGFRGFTVSLVLDQPSSVDATVAAALAAGGTEVKPVSRSLWGYGGTVAAPDGTVVTVASAQKKDTGPATSEIQQLVVQLAVDDVAASTAFYAERGVGTGRKVRPSLRRARHRAGRRHAEPARRAREGGGRARRGRRRPRCRAAGRHRSVHRSGRRRLGARDAMTGRT